MLAFLSSTSRPSLRLSDFSNKHLCKTKRGSSLLVARGSFTPSTWERVVLGRRRFSGGSGSSLRVRATATAGVSLIKPKQTGDKFLDLCINTIRFLAVDAVEKANSGHPGAPMGQAPMAFTLWDKFLRFNPKNPDWVNRDRFVLSSGHGSMLLYALLYLYGYDRPTIEDIKQFRQLGSCTAGHPENFLLPGVEVTTGPLGSGVAQAVGLAMAEAHLAAMFNTPEEKLVDHYTYFIMGDGCAQEGVASEASSLAGHLRLGKLIGFYDDNKITIDGHTDLSFSEDVAARYEAYGWQVIKVSNGNEDLAAIEQAIKAAKNDITRPSLIVVSTLIGYGSPNKADTHDVHGAALGADEVRATRENLGWTYPPFEVPDEALKHFRRKIQEGARLEHEWTELFGRYKNKHPDQAALFERMVIRKEKSPGWEKALKDCAAKTGAMATRQVSGAMLNALASVMPEIIGGSADLAPSNNTLLKGFGDFSRHNYKAKNLRFGVREAAMTAITAGIKLHGTGLFPYCATFLIFTDYARGMLRLAALSEAGITFVTTHDSVGLGEDGPTHQPIEQLASLRAMPNLYMFRPCDANECAAGYALSIKHDDKVVLLALTRQKTNKLDTSSYDGALRGAYVVSDNSPSGAHPDVILIGTGSEVDVVMEAADQLRTNDGMKVRVVSMPCMELFEEQDAGYQESVFPSVVPRSRRVVCEAATSFGWSRYADHFVCIDRFGASGKGPDLMKFFGITPTNVVEKARGAVGKGL
ncbi:hypothetical protein F1559_003759 [Cyanidiococcus yangmingshanensis]|uniref:transketolase n=1 Tax=Cyanidiococcus yangmingshanensis TaxID=2690220 RepID=A0A7J7IMD6_9RHOD|nr:hypothetical protein F1559_003759 [Cyanidiococcus yangmingshanensis]